MRCGRYVIRQWMWNRYRIIWLLPIHYVQVIFLKKCGGLVLPVTVWFKHRELPTDQKQLSCSLWLMGHKMKYSWCELILTTIFMQNIYVVMSCLHWNRQLLLGMFLTQVVCTFLGWSPHSIAEHSAVVISATGQVIWVIEPFFLKIIKPKSLLLV